MLADRGCRSIARRHDNPRTAGDNEFHARLNNTQSTGGAGTQRVVWCYDPERNGCSDSRVKSTVFVNWVQ